jgi:hypothetical protein
MGNILGTRFRITKGNQVNKTITTESLTFPMAKRAKTIAFKHQDNNSTEWKEPEMKEYSLPDEILTKKWTQFYEYLKMDLAPEVGGPVQPRIFIKHGYIPGLGENTLMMRTQFQFEISYTFEFRTHSMDPYNRWVERDYNKKRKWQTPPAPWNKFNTSIALPWWKVQYDEKTKDNKTDEVTYHYYPNKWDITRNLINKDIY